MTDVTEYLCVLTESVPKLGRTGGELSFKLLTSLDKRQLFLTMTANEGGGYFSREIVPFSALMACLPEDKTEAFPAKRFAVAFQGKSANQPGFCVAILRGLQLLKPAEDKASYNLVNGDWARWQKEMLAKAGEPYVPVVKVSKPDEVPVANPEGDPSPSGKPSRKKPESAEVRHDHPQVD